VLRLVAGQAVFGLAEPAQEIRSRLFAARSPDAELLQIPTSRLKELEPSGEASSAARRMMDEWIEAVSGAIAPASPPKSFTVLEAGRQIKIHAQACAATNRDVVWVRHVQGASQFFGDATNALADNGRFFPLATSGWIESGAGTSLDCIDTATYLKRDRDWAGFVLFQNLVLPQLESQVQRRLEHERARRSAMHASDQDQMNTALKRLIGSLNRKKGPSLLEDLDADPLIAACQMVGAAAGISIASPIGDAANHEVKDPLNEIARASRIRLRKVLLRGRWWKEDHGALVGFRSEGMRPLALIPVRDGYEWHDPSSGEQGRVHAKMALELDPSAHFFYRAFPDKQLTAHDVLLFGLHNCKREVRALLMAGILAGLIGLLTPILTSRLFNQIIPGAQRAQLMQLAGLLAAGAVGAWMFEITRNLALLRIEGKMGVSLQAAVWDRLLSLPVSFFRDYNAGDLSDRANGIDAIRRALTGTVSNSVITGVFSIFHLALMIYYSWRLTLVALALLLIAAIITLYNGKMQTRQFRIMSRLSGQVSGHVLQLIGGVAKIRISGTESRAFAIWSKRYSSLKSSVMALRTDGNSFSVFNTFYLAAGPMAIFYAVYDWSGRLNAGDFLAFNAAFGAVFGATMQLASAIIQIQSMRPIFERALPLLHAKPEVDASKKDPGELTGDIELSRVLFRYQKDGPEVIRDVSLRVEPGQFVAIVGPSGCGKSTLFRLLLGFERPESGGIYYNGQDLQNLDLASVRRQMGVVLQSSMLFRGDLFSNIIGSRPLTLDDAWEAAKLAGIEADIRNMPMGMHSVITEGGGGLSGGQRQRLMIARAIASKPRILLFDEATSALDNQTQGVVSRSLESLKATRIVIAHRLSTVINADKIFVMDQGKIVQAGSYKELIAQSGLFADLAGRQLA
jgi:NHLM bacteriocin system ABC transporter ATP-binding protein